MSLDLLKGLGVKIPYKAKYDNFIGGKWVAPVKGDILMSLPQLQANHILKLPAQVLKTWNWLWMLHTQLRMDGQKRLLRNVQTCCLKLQIV